METDTIYRDEQDNGKEPKGKCTEKATFAGGCFWCMEAPFENLEGVCRVVSGYTGGSVSNPTYEAVSTGRTGHAEAVQVTFDPEKISYERLLDVFWRQIDPTDAGGSFHDQGSQYRSAIFYPDKKKIGTRRASGPHPPGSGSPARFHQRWSSVPR